MVDIVSIGYEINAKGLEKANKEVDALHAKIDKLGKSKAVDAKATVNTKQQVASLDATTKALEKQALVGQYLGKGFDKSTATSIASFKMLGATVDQTNSQLNQLVQNKGLVKTQKDLEALNKQQQKAQEQAKATQLQYQKLSHQSFGGGVLSAVDQQNKALVDMRKHYQNIETFQNKQTTQVQKTVSSYEKLSSKSLGGGILDTVDRQSKGLQDLNKYY